MSFSASEVSVQGQLDQLLWARVEQASRTVTKAAQAAQNFSCVGNCPFSYLVFWSWSEGRFFPCRHVQGCALLVSLASRLTWTETDLQPFLSELECTEDMSLQGTSLLYYDPVLPAKMPHCFLVLSPLANYTFVCIWDHRHEGPLRRPILRSRSWNALMPCCLPNFWCLAAFLTLSLILSSLFVPMMASSWFMKHS